MNGKKVFMISAIMSLALIGLIVLQVSWIRRDLGIREERFAQQVSEAMNNVTEKLETGETVHIIARALPGVVDDTIVHYFSHLEPIFPTAAEMPDIEFPEVPDVGMPDTLVLLEKSNSYSFEVYDPEIPEPVIGNECPDSAKAIARSANTRITVSVSDHDAVINKEMKKAAHDMEKARADMVKVREELQKVNKVQKKIALERSTEAKKLEKLDKAVQKMTLEYEMREKRLTDRVKPESVDSMVGSELRNQGIVIPFSVILKDNTDSIVYSRISVPADTAGGRKFEASLFPDNIVNRGDHMEVLFSDTMVYFLSSMWIRLLSSVLFTATIVFIFAYTLYVILRQKKLSEMKNDFINNMTHEFKTPIATIRLASEALNNPIVASDTEKLRYYARVIRDENERMHTHVENILQLARFNKNGIELALSSFDPHDLIEGCIRKVKLQADQKNANLEFIDKTEGISVEADQALLEIVLLNLLDNAIKYTTTNPLIRITLSLSDENVSIEVADNGIGMTRETQRHIFEQFYRVPTGNLHNVKGFGLGLTYAGAIVSAHMGIIQVNSEPGSGSSFKVIIPQGQKLVV